ncbi:MAG: V-type ATP synthase subunit F [Desulfurococcales archaeon]|nr:V-type ATP synthase subunit F [Desulfurococcales archaeon]
MEERARIAVVGDRYSIPLFRSVGMVVEEAESQAGALDRVKALASRGDIGLIIVLKHLVEDEDSFRSEVGGMGVPVLILPTRWSKAEPVNVDKLVAKALGLG